MLQAQNAQLILSAAHSSQFPETTKPEVVMVGKSNVGKSSLINALTNRKRLAYVGQRPGKTRLINFFDINEDLLLVDVPGYGFANRSKQEQIDYGKLMDSYYQLRHPALMLLLVDCRRGMADEDYLMLEFAFHHDIDTAIVLTKTDKLSRSKVVSLQRNIERDTDLEVFLFSAIGPNQVDKITNRIQKVCR
ncbi:ribosome biogenesis GTP-binding protein [Erysipelothrix larvae]|uniref:Probable GTP-binding protein EngB n=1 Tax=Erysipelothrix larvae TaxID=1514105 RepID=A0A109UGN3_9FIRM|nr:ribosome biogenesis GTP-binding protein YihA/YsxC [Erysipelothrix larvae]AMC92987.1 ribosome biogenesis GTP-binding protein [Erysipelothrix larvae]